MAAAKSTFVLLCICFLLLSTTEMKFGEADQCARYSQSWTGVCLISSHCNDQCKKREKALYGACHLDDNGSACFCYFKC